MGLKIVAKKRFLNSFQKVTSWLKKEWVKKLRKISNQ